MYFSLKCVKRYEQDIYKRFVLKTNFNLIVYELLETEK